MAVNDQTVELKTQELVFIGNMFINPQQMVRYATFVETNKMIETEPARSIWRALYLYYSKYNDLPDEKDFVPIFGEKGAENLQLGIAVAGSEETRASFILDTFADTMKANVFKQVSSKLAEIYAEGKVDNDKAKKAIDSVYTKLSIIDRSANNTEEGDLVSIFHTWVDGNLQMQRPRIPIPIPGLEFMSGTPVGSVNVVVGSYGSGKEQPKSLVIPTPDGNKVFGSLRPGDRVFGADGKPTQVLGVFDNGLKDIYRVTFNDGSSTLCGAGHLWAVRDHEDRMRVKVCKDSADTWQVLTTEEIVKRGVRRSRKWQSICQWEIPSYQPVQYQSDVAVPVHPYLMGLWLGIGDNAGRLWFSFNGVEILKRLKRLGLVSSQNDKRIQAIPCVFIDGLKDRLFGVNLTNLCREERYIPTVYLESSVEDRIELLRGLLESHGECLSAGPNYCFGSTSRNLCESVSVLVRSLAGKAYPVRSRRWLGSEKDSMDIDSYFVDLVLPPTIFHARATNNKGWSLTRWIDSIERLDSQEECMCIKVANPDGLYLTNDFIVTHNTSTLCTMAAELSKSCNVLYVTLETPAESLAFRIMSNFTDGAVASNTVFLNPSSVTDNEVETLKGIRNALVSGLNNRYTVYFLDLPAGEVSPAQLALYLRNLHFRDKVNIPVMIIDYAALMKTNAGTGREEIGWGYTGVILKELSAVAKGLGITIWVAAQAGGEKAHTIMSSNPINFKPLRGNDLYGSKEVLQDASLVLGLSFLRSREYPRLAAGIISTIKNRYGEEFYDMLCTMDYSKSLLKSEGVMPVDIGDGDCVDTVTNVLRDLELKFAQLRKLQRKTDISQSVVPFYNMSFKSTSGSVNKPKTPAAPVEKSVPESIRQGTVSSQDSTY